MAVIKYNTGDGGTNGAVVTVANSGGASGDVWGNVFSAGAWTYTNALTVKGGIAYRVDQAASTAAGLEMTFGGSRTTHYGRAYIYMSAFAANEHPVVRGYALTYADSWRIAINSSGQLCFRNKSGTLLGTTSQSITTGGWYRLEWRVVNADATSQMTVNVYSGDLTTPAFSYTNNACDLESETIAIHFGPSLPTPQVPTMYFDEIATDDAAYIGPANIVNQPPTADAGADQNVIEGSIVTLNASGSTDAEGAVTYAWSQLSGTAVTLSSATVAQPTFTAPAAGSTLTFEVAVTDSGSLVDTDTVTILVGSTLLRFNKAEGGTNGVAVSTANSGGISGDAWDSVSGTTAWAFDNTTVARGTLGYKCTQTNGAAATLAWDLFSVTEVYGRCYWYFTGFAGATQVIIRNFTGGFVNESWRLDLQNDGILRLRDANTNSLGLSAQALLPGVWYRLEWHVKSGTTNGIMEFKAFTADQTSPLFNYSNTACNTNTAMDALQFGPGFSNTLLPVFYVDEFALSEDGWIGTAAGTPLNSPPTANAGNDQSVGTSTTVTLNGEASADTDGAIASYAWSQTGGTAVSLSSPSVAKPTFTAPASASTLTFQLTVTDDDGATAVDAVTVNVLSSIVMQNSAEGGTDGTGTTTANSGGASGNAWQTVNSTYWKFASAHAARGSLGYQCDAAAAIATVLQWQLSPALAEHYGRLYFYWSGFGPNADNIARLWAAGFNECFRIEVSGTQRLAVRTLSAGTLRYTGTNTLTAAWYRLEWHAVSSTTVGLLEVKLFLADQTSPIEDYASTASLNIQAETSWIQIGPSMSMTPAPPTKWFDEIVIGSASGGWIGKAAGVDINQAPTADAGVDATLEPYNTCNLQGSATDDGSIVSWAWRQISGPSVSLSSTTVQNPTFTVPAIEGGVTLVFGLIVTDDRGASSTEDTVTITALKPTLFFARDGAWKP